METSHMNQSEPALPVSLIVEGMTCGGCEKSVTRAIEALGTVEVLTVDRSRSHVAIRWPVSTNQSRIDQELSQVCEAVEAAGFDCRLA